MFILSVMLIVGDAIVTSRPSRNAALCGPGKILRRIHLPLQSKKGTLLIVAKKLVDTESIL
jgi:hypothetical protein